MTNQQESSRIKSSEVVFFFGAGASVAAGVPTTFSFVNEFVDSIQDPDKRSTIKKIVETLETWKKEKIDIELLLDTLTKLQEKDQEPLLPFFPGGTYILKDFYEKEPLINDLKDFIKSKAIVESEERIRYLEPFRELIEESRPLDIISVNYDTSIEQFCSYYRLAYQDGFEFIWDPSVFQKEHTDIRLYKIHGSVMWYQSDRSGYLKLPVMTRENIIQLISGEKAENLMLYPMKKWDLAVPLLELLVETKRLIESETCKILVIVGYSFRDDHIKRILFDAARKNKELIIFLIDPNAYQIYSTKLRYYDINQTIPSALAGRVICLPYLFERIFPDIKNHYLKKINEGLAVERSQRKIEISGGKAIWISCIQSFADVEYIEKIETLLNREPFDAETYWPIILEVYCKMAVNLMANKETEKGKKYLTLFCNLLKSLMIDKINVEIIDLSNRNFVGYDIEVSFNYVPHFDPKTKIKNGSSSASVQQYQNIFIPLFSFCQKRIEFSDKIEIEFEMIFNKINMIKKYLDTFKEGKISIDDYIRLRQDYEMNKLEFARSFSIIKSESLTMNRKNELIMMLVENERKILRQIID